MKLLYYSLALVANLSLLASCSNDTEDSVISDVKIQKTFGVSTPNSDTRAYIDDFDGTKTTASVYWANTDKITIIAKGHTTGDTFNFVDWGSFHSNAKFTGMTYEADQYWAIYPAQPNAKLDSDGFLTVNIPNQQQAINGTFDPNAAIQIGHSNNAEGGLLGLKHLCAFFVFKLKPNALSVKLESTDGWKLAGNVTADPKSGGAIIKKLANDCQTSIELTNIPTDGGTFFIAFIPSNGSTGEQKPYLKLTVDREVGPTIVQFSTTSQFLSATTYDLGEL